MQLQFSSLLALLTAAASVSAAPAIDVSNETAEELTQFDKRATVPGFDVSHYQGCVNMQAQKNAGAQFVIIKATEGGHMVFRNVIGHAY